MNIYSKQSFKITVFLPLSLDVMEMCRPKRATWKKEKKKIQGQTAWGFFATVNTPWHVAAPKCEAERMKAACEESN